MPTADFLQEIIKATGCNGHWLLMGENFKESGTTEEPTPTYISRAATQVQKTEDEIRQALAGALIEIGYLKQQVSDKEEIITLMKKI
jgi:hypothetical protein